jgi:hypothetical protein
VTHGGRADLRAQVDALKAKIGVQGVLRRRRFDDLTVAQWRTARLLDVRERGVIEERGIRARLDCVFESASVGWRAATISSASVLLNAPVGVTGLLPVRNASLTITASATITAISFAIAAQGVSWSWTGSLTAGQSLVIADKARTVRIGSTDSYSGFSLASGHTAAGWLTMAPGLNADALSVTGTASAAALSWWNTFA